MKKIVVLFFILAFFLVQSVPVAEAAKKGASPVVSAVFIKPRNSVNLYIANLKNVKSVAYVLMYQSNGVGQGVEGSFYPSKKKTTFSKSLYLGTCSGKVCVAHRNIKNIQIELTIRYTNGKTTTKVYKVK